MALNQSAIQGLAAIVGPKSLLTDPGDCWPYGYDNSRRQGLPAAVAFVSNAEQVEALVQLANQHSFPVTARGLGTGTTGATVPERNGIVIAFERMNRILRIDPANRLAVVEPGVVNETLQRALGEHGFFWPPDPTSAAICTIGGNLAYNSAGPRAVKYGTPRENTLGLAAVTGSGQRIRAGVLTTKGVVGYDLTRLIIGSEGTLALITEATLKLTPVAEAKQTLRATYRDIHAAADAVAAIMAQPITPCALEFMDAAAIDMVRQYSDLGVSADTGALLMIEVDGPADCVSATADAVASAARNPGLLDLSVARDREQIAALWRTRKALSPALRHVAPKKINEDVVVPVSRIATFIDTLEQLAHQYRIRIVNFGHAGNGNIHVNLLVNPDDVDEMARAADCLAGVFDCVVALGGTLSGEHGVGLEKRDFIDREIDPPALALMRAIKAQFDPNGILNPGKGLPLIAPEIAPE
ncbi:FAD-binding oxidoreductase [Lamprobacter modestohalophilus]|uniref:FAD-binding oxidoreductase n=1 Tax=Lamprobacter modestohalophilus TaxID=1064514 RepID=A0A9X1B274_9GAMM|nr:FAD-linked oxidase C-terminal domain-containing protein [Lamprobacter modestohalophilus]MBK1617083.1 FAD-binding oxidoreductase [Lamprobacter modestohalophilus]MCF7993625.1 FAD-binding protein [Chromatiaceae bacterium]